MTQLHSLDAALLAGEAVAVPAFLAGQRLDKALATLLREAGVSRERGRHWIEAGRVLLDDVPCLLPRQIVAPGAALRLLPDQTAPAIPPPMAAASSLRVLHADESVLVVDKPAGLTVHPAPSVREPTLVHQLLERFPDLAAMGLERPGIVHRIDKDTSGLLVVARTELARQRLAADFESRRVDKAYLALCQGLPPAHGRVDAPMGRHPTRKTCMTVLPKGGRAAVTDYRVLLAAPDGGWALLGLIIHTGRTHQIRVHCKHLGHPLLGDGLYGGPLRRPGDRAAMRQPGAPRQMLHAWRLAFRHPETGRRMTFQSPLPRDFLGTLLRLRRRSQRVAITGLPGCGKSALARLQAEAGLPVFEADACVAGLYAPGEDGWTLLRRRFGDRFLRPDATVDKAALAQALLDEPGLRRELETVLHPLVRHRLEVFQARHAAAPLTVAEIPLLLETGWGAGGSGQAGLFDLAVAVHCPAAARHDRLRARGWDEARIAAMEGWQWDETRKLRGCQLIVDNAGSLADLERKALALRHVLARLRAAQARRFLAGLPALLEDREP